MKGLKSQLVVCFLTKTRKFGEIFLFTLFFKLFKELLIAKSIYLLSVFAL